LNVLNERAIINFAKQEGVFMFLREFLPLGLQNIHSLKFYGFGTDTPQPKKFKYDKVVIYYNGAEQQKILKDLRKAANGCPTINELSGFYHIYAENCSPSSFRVGVGKKPGDGLSFTERVSYKLLAFLTQETVDVLQGKSKEKKSRLKTKLGKMNLWINCLQRGKRYAWN
jgi:hypothetical protein